MKLKTDEEYKKIDEEDRKRGKRLFKSFSKSLKGFDKRNKYWLKFVKDVSEEIQLQIIQASPFPSTAVMLWISIGNSKERDIKLQIIKEWENLELLKRTKKTGKK